MAGVSKHQAGCTCCQCPSALTVAVRCNSSFSNSFLSYVPISNATVTVAYQGNGTLIDSGTTDANGGVSFTLATTPGNSTVTAVKTGWNNATGTVNFNSCQQNKSITLETCRSSQTITVISTIAGGDVADNFAGPCAIGGASVSLSGHVSGSGTSAANGRTVFTVAAPANCSGLSDVTVSGAPPAGYGAANSSYSLAPAVYKCQDYTVYQHYGPANGYTGQVCGSRYIPETLYYSDNYGSCTLTFDSPSSRWVGSYSYTSTAGTTATNCSGITRCVGNNATGTVTSRVEFGGHLQGGGPASETCGPSTLSAKRFLRRTIGRANCNTLTSVRATVLDSDTTCLAAGNGSQEAATKITSDCGESLSVTFTNWNGSLFFPGAPELITSATVTAAPPGGDSTWPFDADAEGWSSTTFAGTTTGGWVNTDGSPDAGCYQVGSTGFNTHVDHAEWAGTFEDLGVPPGTTVTGITLTSIKSKAVSVDSFGSIGLCQFYLLSSGGSTLATLLASRLATANETTWTESNGTEQTISQASNTSIRLQLVTTLDSGLSSAAMTARYDSIDIALEYA
jgi:hypothetical protein